MDILGHIMGTKKGSKKRFWSDDEKRSICLQTKASGVSVAQVARRYAMNANLIHNWLRDPRFAPEAEDEMTEGAGFLPVEIEGALAVPDPQMLPLAPDAPLSAQRVDITLSDGRRILVEGTTALSAVLALVEGLMP
jgi:transposase